MGDRWPRTLLAVSDLTIVRDGDTVLRDVSFDVRASEEIAVVGPNGAGKSSLFQALLGLLPAARGSFDAPAGLAYVPQAAPRERSFPVTALEVALMGAYGRVSRFGRIPTAERERARDALARVGLDSPETPFDRLSAGQRRRALVARALVQGGGVMLLDEPFSDVDVVSERRIAAVLDDERARGHAVVMATHDLGFALRHATRALLLNVRAHAFGPPADALTSETLSAAYGGRLVVLGDGHGQAVDEVAHHDHEFREGAPGLPGEVRDLP
jgi:ABC-type Mn2+/Zn2+ transport system ATPase subunit